MNNKFSPNSSAYLLVSHGSSDRNHQIAVEKLATSIRQQLEIRIVSKKYSAPPRQDQSESLLSQYRSPIVATAQLESASIPLHQSILQLALKLEKLGTNRLRVFPLFLLPGIHVKEDIPAEIAIARERLGDSIAIELMPYLGSNLNLTNLIETQFAKLPSSERILLSHGSRRQGGNRPCEEIAFRLKANTAYCLVSPSLREKVRKIATKGTSNIAIVPYFLFAGKIIKLIAQEIEELQQEFPKLNLFLGQPLATTPELACSIVQRSKLTYPYTVPI